MFKTMIVAVVATVLSLPAVALASTATQAGMSATPVSTNVSWNPVTGVPFKIPASQKFHGKRPIHGFYHQGVKMVAVNSNKPQCILHGYQPAPGRPGYCININQGDPGPGGY
ncbi:MAG TPA: hypothetical protein VFA48_06170 [Gammaproteobacteria bacterium]|nr:hypothetical protein [Gammaproteobacteria bacterium]